MAVGNEVRGGAADVAVAEAAAAVTLKRMGDSGDQAGAVTEITAVRHQSRQLVTAVRTSQNSLKLLSWRVNGDGSVTRTGDSGDQAGAASHIDLARGARFVTALRAGNKKLKLVSWDVTAAGAISRAGDSGEQAGEADSIKVVALTRDLFVVACRTADRTLRLISWRLNADGSLTRLHDSGNAAGAVGEISLIVFRASSRQVATSVRDGDGKLKVILWRVAAGGAFTRLGDSGAQAGEATVIRSAKDSLGRLVTAVRAGNDSLKLIGWRVSADGQTVTRLGDSGDQAGFISDQALMARTDARLVSAVRAQNGNLKLITWSMSAAGNFTRTGDSGEQAGAATLITLCQETLGGAAGVVSGVRAGNNNLKLISWADA